MNAMRQLSNVSVRGVDISFGAVSVLEDLNLEVHPSEFLVLLGPSGCGKSTLLNAIAGLIEVDGGQIWIGGRNVTWDEPKDRGIAMVFQSYALYPRMTVRGNLSFGLQVARMPRAEIERRVRAAAQMLQIEELLDRRPIELSGGQRQRVAMGRAIVRSAQIYLYDEPLSNLDAQLRYQAREDVLALHRARPKPSVYVTHDQSEAMALGDRIAVMRDGAIQQIGTGEELYERPRNRFVAFFIGTPSINLFEAELRAEADEQLVVSCPAFSLPLPKAWNAALADHVGRPVTFGIRPEDLHSSRTAPFEVAPENTIHGVVNVIEPTAVGSTVYLSTLVDEPQDFVATFKQRVPSSYLGKEIPLAIDAAKAHLFDRESERSLCDGA
jgi:multiple sugar transport system ATP-binding protein